MYERSLFIGDIHAPFQDNTALKVMYSFAKWFKPDYVFILGDLIDWYAISSFDKDPNRALKIQEEIDETQIILGDLRRAVGKAHICLIPGNHSKRLMKYLWKHPEIANLNALTLPNLLNLQKFMVDYWDKNCPLNFHGFMVEHGDIVRKHSGYTAKGMMEKRGVSGISGHTHRLGTSYLTNENGDSIWVENGCLCERTTDYYFGTPNWQQGFTIGYYKKDDNRFSIEQVVITKGRAAFAGREFTAR